MYEKLKSDKQCKFLDVALEELSTFGHWRALQVPVDMATLHAKWDSVTVDEKSDWVPDNPRESLAADGQFAALL
jgi:hypothetical protein